MKSTNKKIFALVLALLAISLKLLAQQVPAAYSVGGKVVDATTKQPMVYTTVILKSDKNAVIKQIVTKTDGSFVFTGIPRSKYNLVLVNVGYQNKTITVDMADASKSNTDLGIISMEVLGNNLKEVAVKADKPIIKQEIDRLSYDPAGRPGKQSE